MRVTTDFWVSSVVRRAFSLGGFAGVDKRGATEAGAVLLIARGRMGEVKLFAPAPQTSYDDARPQDRLFTEIVSAEDDEAIRQRIERELRFDPDLWIVELEVDESVFAELVSVTMP